jgi:hypothetical protein
MQQEFEQRGAIEPVLKLRPLYEMRGAGAFDGVVHLGRIEVKFICHLEIGGPPVFQRELEQHDDIQWPQHITSAIQMRSIFK